ATLAEFERATAEFRRAEAALFKALFDTRDGLRQSFQTPDIAANAKKALCGLSFRAQELARKHGLFDVINPEFETNGLPNFGRDYQQHFAHQMMARGRA